MQACTEQVPTHGARWGVTLFGGATYLVVIVLAIKLACALVGDAQLAPILWEVGRLLSTLREALGQGLRVITTRQPLAKVEPLTVLDLARLENGVDVLLHAHAEEHSAELLTYGPPCGHDMGMHVDMDMDTYMCIDMQRSTLVNC
eukprot:6937333-Prymnesium_polylepis.2